MASFGEPLASGALTTTARSLDHGDGLHWAGMSSGEISRHHVRQACPTRTQSSVQLRSPPERQRSLAAVAQRPDVDTFAGAPSTRIPTSAKHIFSAVWDGVSQGSERQGSRGTSCPPVSTDPIAFRHLEGTDETVRPLRRMGYQAPSATKTWDLKKVHTALREVPFSTEGNHCWSAQQRDVHTNGVAGSEDLMPASTRRHIGADLPASSELQRMNDKRELLLSERGAFKGQNPHLASSPELKMILASDNDPLVVDREPRAPTRSQRVHSTPDRSKRPHAVLAPAGGGALPCFSARSAVSSAGSMSGGLWSDVGRTCTAYQLRQALGR